MNKDFFSTVPELTTTELEQITGGYTRQFESIGGGAQYFMPADPWAWVNNLAHVGRKKR